MWTLEGLRKQKVHPKRVAPSTTLPCQVTIDSSFVRSNGWTHPLHPLQLCAWFFLIFFAVSYFLLMIPHLPTAETRCIAGAINAFVFVLHLIIYTSSTTVDPADDSVLHKYTSKSKSGGKVKPAKFDRSKHNHVIENQFCYICEVSVSGKAKHCSACNKCVSRFDHHCKWLNNCIGDKNYRMFIACVSSALVGSVIICAVSTFLVIAFLNPSSWLHSTSESTGELDNPLNSSNYAPLVPPPSGQVPATSGLSTSASVSNNSSGRQGSSDNRDSSGKSEQSTDSMLAPANGSGKSLEGRVNKKPDQSRGSKSSHPFSLREFYRHVWIVIIILNAIFSLVASFLLGHLLLFHMYLYYIGLSTYEFIVKKREEKNVQVKCDQDKKCKCNCFGRLVKWCCCSERKKGNQNLRSKCRFMLRVICCCCCYRAPKRISGQMSVPYPDRGDGGEKGDKGNHGDFDSSSEKRSRAEIACISSNHLDKGTLDELHANQLYYHPPERAQHRLTNESERNGSKLWLAECGQIDRSVDSARTFDSQRSRNTSNSLHGDVYIGSPEKRLARELDVIMNRSPSGAVTSAASLFTPPPVSSHHTAVFTSSVKDMTSFGADGGVKLPPHDAIVAARVSTRRLMSGGSEDRAPSQMNGNILPSNMSMRHLKRMASVDSSLSRRLIAANESNRENVNTWAAKNRVSEHISSHGYPHHKVSSNGSHNLIGMSERAFGPSNSHRHHSQASLANSMSRMNQINKYHTASEHKRHKLTLLRQRSLDQMHQQQQKYRRSQLFPMQFNDQLSREQVIEDKSHENELSFVAQRDSSARERDEITKLPAVAQSPLHKRRQQSLEPMSDEQRSSDQTSLESEPFSPSPHFSTPSKEQTVTFTY